MLDDRGEAGVIPVYWLAPGDQWDQTMLRDLLDGKLWRPAGYPTFEHHVAADVEGLDLDGSGGVLVIPGRYYDDATDVRWLQEALDAWDWALVFITSDEERVFPFERLHGDRRVVWVQTPQEADTGAQRVFGHGYTPGTREQAQRDKTLPWFFAGQITHERRQELAEALETLPEHEALFHPSPGFTQGFDHPTYLNMMAMAKITPCPSGPETVDSFRFWESLELGCVPLADDVTPKESTPNYWDDLGEIVGVPMPISHVAYWADAGDQLIQPELDDWPNNVNRIGAWYMAYKRALAEAVQWDLALVAARTNGHIYTQYDEQITVLISTSPTVGHPSTEQLEQVVESVRFHLPTAPIIISCDGVAPELEHRGDAYREYLRRVMWLAHHEWLNVQPVVHEDHIHQAGMAAHALAHHVHTSQILYMEHDTPLVTDCPIDWWLLSQAIKDHRLNLIRFHHEAQVPAPHRHLMLDNPQIQGQTYRGVPVIRTMQWSQRPHLARTDWYRSLMARYFGEGSCTMIEDVIYGVVEGALFERGAGAWESWRLGIYAPHDPNWKRSLHLDGRGPDRKPAMTFAYPGEQPDGAPAPGTR